MKQYRGYIMSSPKITLLEFKKAHGEVFKAVLLIEAFLLTIMNVIDLLSQFLHDVVQLMLILLHLPSM